MFKRILLLSLFLSLNIWAQETSKVESVNFIQEGEVSKLIIDFSSRVISERNHIKSDKQIILDLKNVTADKKFMRGIDTSEFSGSAVFVSPYKKPGSKNDLRFAIQLRDNVRSFVETKGNRITLHIENRFGVFTRAKLKKVEENTFSSDSVAKGKKILVPKSNSLNDILENLTQSGVKRYVGRKISLNVNNIQYQEILKMIGDTSGFNIIIEDDVNNLKPLTISLTNLPWDQVLDTVMDLGNLVAVKFGNILSIKTADKARLEKQEELDAQSKNKILEPLVTKVFPISYASLIDIIKILKNYSTAERGSIESDKRTQNLIVKDTVEVIERMKKIIETLDTQTPQILIEAKIVEAEEKYEFRAGLSNGIQFDYDPLSDVDSGGAGSFQFNSATNLNGPSILNASLSVARLTNLAFSLELMESESKGKIISSPKVITENNKVATISNTTTRRFVINARDADRNIVPTSTTIPATISLNVTPKVTNEGSIALAVAITKQGFGGQEVAGELPSTTDRSVNTNVLVENGSTVVIGGIYQTEDFRVESGVPFLKDLPLVGWLFKNAYNPSKSRNELIIFLTPRIINQEEAGLVNRELGDDLGL
ncbi:MAG: type IV pilus assembly protein PilQ [Bacteriovoracaceae bacterium]|jgi:type IV pilus assembly protein PilQ